MRIEFVAFGGNFPGQSNPTSPVSAVSVRIGLCVRPGCSCLIASLTARAPCAAHAAH